MNEGLEDARKLAHGTYEDVIVVEHRKPAGAVSASSAAHVVLEMPEGSRVIDTTQAYEIDGLVGHAPPTVGTAYRLIVGPATKATGPAEATPAGSLRYETMHR